MNLATKRRAHYDLVTAGGLHYNTCKGVTMTATTPSITSFPPRDLADFLDLCTGRWMSLRSRFALWQAAFVLRHIGRPLVVSEPCTGLCGYKRIAQIAGARYRIVNALETDRRYHTLNIIDKPN